VSTFVALLRGINVPGRPTVAMRTLRTTFERLGLDSVRTYIKPSIDELRYVPGALVRRIDRADVTRSPMTRIVGSDLYRRVTVRNINTVRKLRNLAVEQSRRVTPTLQEGP